MVNVRPKTQSKMLSVRVSDWLWSQIHDVLQEGESVSDGVRRLLLAGIIQQGDNDG